MAKKQLKKRKQDYDSWFVPAGIFIGVGLGMIYENVAAGALIGLGIGFIITATIMLLKKKK